MSQIGRVMNEEKLRECDPFGRIRYWLYSGSESIVMVWRRGENG